MKWILRLLVAFLILTVVTVAGYFYVDYSLSPTAFDRPVEVEVPSGASLLEVGKILEEKRLVKDDLFFAAYAYLKGKAKAMKAGVYEIPPGAGANEILKIFTDGSRSVMRLTVPEGYTAEQIARKLDEKGVDGSAFLKAADRKNHSQPFVRRIPEDQKRRYLLEGYLFPMTYNLPKDTDPHHLVEKMLDQFGKYMERERVEQKLQERNLTLDQWVTLASIIEREAKVKEEFPRISGVLHNRLKMGKKLQVDATVQYALGEQKARLLYKDLKINHPYNTYRIQGLPPGPISNPGKRALKAALEPEKHDYLYYVTRKDGSGRHYFAKTEAEHQKNIEKSKKESVQKPNRS
ncbi:UPF0755 protein [Melghirimyces profundicolus]|uniref:Endolytic murein transglycosylase n=1 Tax=Melghirimyces profundicolus TaxID=1242148 RepID=A0A2T6BQX4_9BACL|nr:endolytic transglycosylase MltG [Melghirimyces profundicolus]PTX58446.1 UPF0755 protein [Melghirimyces profundicolus]